MPAIHGITGVPWSYCDTCARPFRLSDLQMQNGNLVCGDDFDNPLMFIRDKLVSEATSDDQIEADNETAKRRQEPNIERY